MAKLMRTSEATKYSSYTEYWLLENNIEVSISFSGETCSFFINSDTGDVADQIFKILRKNSKLPQLSLVTLACYIIEVDVHFYKNVLEEIEEIEKIDISRLNLGRSY